MNIYREVVAYINSHKPGTSFTTKDFHKHMASLGYRDSYQPHYRVNTYRTYLSSAGFITQVRRGVWMTVYVIPEWVTLKMLETARGYGRGCNKVVQRETQDRIAAYFADQKRITGTEKTWKIGDQFTHEEGGTVFTIAETGEVDPTHGKLIRITWEEGGDRIASTTYAEKTVTSYINKGIWKLVQKPEPKPERAWKIGDQFVVHSDIVYTIEVGHVKDSVKVTWVARPGHNQSLSYLITTVDECFSKGSWKLIEKTNIQENVSPAQKDSVDLQHTKKQTTMAKQTALPVSPAFIVEAHRVACSDWKAKLEQMYPSVFQPTQTFKVGDKIQFPQSSEFSNATYILADAGKRHMVLINLQSGGRWTEQVVVANPSAITAEEMKKICYNQKLDTILVNGTTPTMATKWSKEKTLTAKISDILAAYEATSDATTKKMIKDYFPEASSRYVKFVESSAGKVTLSPHTSTIDGADFIIGRGLAPRPELDGACIGVYADKVEVEVITSGNMTWVAFKKK